MTTAAPVQSTSKPTIKELTEYSVPSPKSTPAIVRGKGSFVEDENGKRYIDFEGGPGVTNVGHCHPHVVAAIKAQVETLMQGPGRYYSRISLELAKRVAELTHGRLKKVYFGNSGAEANEAAVKFALKHAVRTGKAGYGLISFEYGYHGRLSVPLSLTGLSDLKKGFGPYTSFPGVVNVPPPYIYRCPFGSSTPEQCGNRAVQALRDALKTRVPGEAAMMIAEPILGLSGVIVPPDNYWPQVAEICAENRITLVFDEVFVGMGRTGKMFAHQHWSAQPSIISFAKAIGAGIPLGGVIVGDDVAASLDGNDHNTTFGSNSMLGMAAGHAVLDVIEREKLLDRAQVAGHRMMEGFRRLQSKYRVIGDVRGKGLVIGLELVADPMTKEPLAKLAKDIQLEMRNLGMLHGVSGVHGNVIRLSPPLTISDDEVDHSLELFGRAFAATT